VVIPGHTEPLLMQFANPKTPRPQKGPSQVEMRPVSKNEYQLCFIFIYSICNKMILYELFATLGAMMLQLMKTKAMDLALQ